MNMNQWLVTVGVAAALGLGASNVLAQNSNNNDNKGPGGRQGRSGRGGGPPSQEQIQQWQQQRIERYKTDLEITDDAEWKAIQPLIQKVTDARMAMAQFVGFGRGGMFGRGRGPDNGGGDQGRPRGGMFGTPSPEVEALNKAIEGKASNSEMKAVIAKYQEARKVKQAELEKAQADLRKVLSVRQEAIAMANGWL
jgi:hypothetical protein